MQGRYRNFHMTIPRPPSKSTFFFILHHHHRHMVFLAEMEADDVITSSEVSRPILMLPKKCTNLETNCEDTDNLFIDVCITTTDTEGKNNCIYSGPCNLKLIDSYDVHINQIAQPGEEAEGEEVPMIIADQPPDNQSEVWIDPVRSPHVYNHCGRLKPIDSYTVRHQSTTSIIAEQCSNNIIKNVYNHKEVIRYTFHGEQKSRKPRKQVFHQPKSDAQYKDDEFENSVFLSHLPEEIINEKQIKAKEEQKYIVIQSENSALKQLMSPGIQSMSKQQKTILFLGTDPQCGQTIQQIAYNDPTMECSGGPGADNEVVIDDSDPPRQKRYQCAKCHQIFDLIADFRKHMVNHSRPKPKFPANKARSNTKVRYICGKCGKNLKTKEKFEKHLLGHGDPDLKCNRCHKVFATKYTLRTHRKIHSREFPCKKCTKTYTKVEEMRAHAAKAHFMFLCDLCDFVGDKHSVLTTHRRQHQKSFLQDSNETEFADSIFDDVMGDDDVMGSNDPDSKLEDENAKSFGAKYTAEQRKYDEIQKADSVIAKVISNKIFLAGKSRSRLHRKVCELCQKSFSRISDLKRHLIEHIVRSTLAKTPVTRAGTLTIRCEVCHAESFTKIDDYKAHLREHAKLTLYQCTYCSKSFSDSSNFSKHKKIHGNTYFECDWCQRKFNSKKMITRHMEYHNANKPQKCLYCGKVYHFESVLNKHIKSAHTKEHYRQYRCQFCRGYFKSLKEKLDHEWTVHNARKMIADCRICGAQFRKYSDLKRHCGDEHKVDIPTAKKILEKENY